MNHRKRKQFKKQKETKQVDDGRPSATELAAQQNAIQHETDLADESPEAQAIQEAKSEVDSNNKTLRRT